MFNILQVSTWEYISSPFFAYLFGITSIIYLLLPTKTAYSLNNRFKRYQEWKSDVGTFGAQKTTINLKREKTHRAQRRIFTILLVYSIISLLNHYGVIHLWKTPWMK